MSAFEHAMPSTVTIPAEVLDIKDEIFANRR